MQYFEYGEAEIQYLKSKDKRLGEAIDRIGPIQREVIPNLFEALVNCIVGQQISMKAVDTIWNRILLWFGAVTPERMLSVSAEKLQKVGISMRKAQYIQNIARMVQNGSFRMDELDTLSDGEVAERLSALNGVGVWTAEMLMIFSMQRKNILSWDDLAIRRGIMKLYHHRSLDKDRFEKYRRRYAPYGSVASLYLWEISLQK